LYADDDEYTFATVQDAAQAYVEPEPVYVEPEPVYVEPEPVYVEPTPELSDAEMSDIELQILAGRNILDAVQQANDHSLYYD